MCLVELTYEFIVDFKPAHGKIEALQNGLLRKQVSPLKRELIDQLSFIISLSFQGISES
jgi:hypothetical protein